MRANIKDVAKEAGVSITTVSRVINNNYPVKKETREKIEEVIKRLSYKPNEVARSLILKKSSVIEVIVPGITNLFFPTIVEAIEGVLKKNGYSIFLSNTGGDSILEKKLINEALSKQVDGIIIMDPSLQNMENGYFASVSANIPFVIVNGAPYDNSCNYVSYNEETGTKEALTYLYELGHRNIIFLRGTNSYSYDIKEALYLSFMKEKNIAARVLKVGGGNSIEVVEKATQATQKLLISEKEITAFFACNDLMAHGVLNAASRLNKKIPKDLSLISCDNTILASLSKPKFTSIDMDMANVGEAASRELLNIIRNEIVDKKTVLLETRLLIRESCRDINESKNGGKNEEI